MRHAPDHIRWIPSLVYIQPDFHQASLVSNATTKLQVTIVIAVETAPIIHRFALAPMLWRAVPPVAISQRPVKLSPTHHPP